MTRFLPEDIETSLDLPGGDNVVLVNWERLNDETSQQRNVFRLNDRGEVVWQVGNYRPMPGKSTFTNIYFDEHGKLLGYNFDGGEYEIDAGTGAVGRSHLLK